MGAPKKRIVQLPEFKEEAGILRMWRILAARAGMTCGDSGMQPVAPIAVSEVPFPYGNLAMFLPRYRRSRHVVGSHHSLVPADGCPERRHVFAEVRFCRGADSIKVAFFLTKGLLGLLIVVPLLLIFGSIFLALLPVGVALLVLLVLPLVLLGGAAVKFASC